MRATKLLLTCVCCILIAVPAMWGQAAESRATPGVLGYVDPHTGAFRAIPVAVDPDAELAAATIFTGTVTLTITITVKTTSLTNFTCNATVSAIDAPSTIFTESNSVAATGTGTTRTCKLSIPYSWGLTTQSTDNMSTSYEVFGSTGATGLPQRISTRSPLDTRKVPASGAITALTAAVTQ